MDIEKIKGIIEAILFAAGRIVTEDELMLGLEISKEDIESIIQNMQEEFKNSNRGIEIIKVDNGYQLCSKKEYYDYIYPILDKRNKPRLSVAALETLSIIAYNPKVTRAEIEAIRGVSSDASIYKLLEFGLIENAGKLDLPGRPTTYKTTNEFLRMFGYSSLDELPELPRYKMDENQQIVIDDLVDENKNIDETVEKVEDIEKSNEKNIEAPEPEREDKINVIEE